MKLVKDIYAQTAGFPRHELYGLASQLRRAAVSVPSNLAEGASRNSRGEFRQFIGNARGSLAEVETQLEIAKDLAYIEEDAARRLLLEVDEISRMLAGTARLVQPESVMSHTPTTIVRLRLFARYSPLATRYSPL